MVDFPTCSTVKEMYSSSAYQAVVADSQSPYCQRCWDKESLGITSKRQADTKLHKVYNTIDPDYLKIDAAIGVICNAACRTCGPPNSSLWQQNEKKFHGLNLQTIVQGHDLWPTVENNLDRILQLDFGGGEPWLNQVEEQEKIFEQLIVKGLAKRIKLRYNTNGSVQPRSLLEKFSHFRAVEITLSLDDREHRFEYNRYPLVWNEVVDNVAVLKQLSRDHNNICLTVNYTVSVLTFLYAQEFSTWARTNGFTDVNWNIATLPKIYSIRSLPNSVKEQLDPTQMFYDLVAKNPLTDWKEQFFVETNRLDQQRKQSFADTFPELWSLL
jgi:MoaA/NifB/PqqE/SkfB family radical SAM enzyme